MSIHYVLGRAGKGKSSYIFGDIKKHLNGENQQKIILLVPEQFTLQAERDLLKSIEQAGMMQVEVLSISSLSNRVLAEAGGNTRTLLNEQGRNMVLKRIIEEQASSLSIYSKSARQEGFIKKLGSLISTLKQNDISAVAWNERQKDLDESSILGQKMRDVGLLYEELEEFLLDRYVDMEDRINLFISKLSSASVIEDAYVYIDGFTTFSSQSLRVIEEIMTLATETTISFTLPASPGSKDDHLFDLSRQSLHRIQEIARVKGLAEEFVRIDPMAVDKGRNPELNHLERSLYAYPFRTFQAEPQNIRIFAGMNIYSEVENTAAQLISLVRDEESLRWRDMLVVCNDMALYGPIIERVFHRYEIPFFLDQKRDIMNNPIIRLVLSALDIVDRNYQFEDVFAFLKTGFADLNAEQCEKLENYALRYGIRGKKWKEGFVWGSEEEIPEFNEWRQLFVRPLLKLEKRLKSQKSIRERTEALYAFLEAVKLEEKLDQWTDKLRKRGYYEFALENAQIWNIVMDSFDQLVEILGDQEVSIKEFRRILEAGFQSYELGIIPTTVDQVLVGSIQRSKSTNVRALFVIGANDGVLPSRTTEEEILSQEEQELLRERGLEFGLDREMKAEEEKFLIYAALASPKNHLWISYAMSDIEGKALRPSLLIDRMKTIFPRIVLRSDLIETRETQMKLLSRPESSYQFLADNLRTNVDGKDIHDFWWDAYDWYFQQAEWDLRREATITALFHRNQPDPLSGVQAGRLYALPMKSSVSRIEKFVKCPFAHFLQYGLHPSERKTYELANPDIGDIFHRSLQRFANKVDEQELTWSALNREQSDGLMAEVMNEIKLEHGNGVLLSTYRYQYLAKRLERISKRAAWTLTEHLQKGQFEPLGVEMSFGLHGDLPPIRITLSNGEELILEGRIDRVDRLDDGDAGYIKIIDYKSGSKDIRLSDVYYGLSLQLLVYLSAVLESPEQQGSEALKPAGVFYFRIDDPYVEAKEDLVEEIEKEIRKKLKMTGLALEDIHVVQAMDSDLMQSSEILPLALKADGTFAARSSVLSEENFALLLEHVKSVLERNGQAIMEGEIGIEPVKNGKEKACDYCLYRSICQFDRAFENNRFRSLKVLGNEEVMARIQKGGEQA